ncbi:MAG: DUF3106 domain-containing protein [Sulfuritalea sp.]|nr:DUF3106 domain-containing protein [Sulfuritalea sp.]
MARARFGLILAIALWLASPLSHAVISPPLSQPSWVELSAEQKRVLAPLSGEWDNMEGFRRKKWLGIAQRYQSMAPDEQARMQRRMTDWAKLTPDERKRARDRYKSLQKAPAEKKEAVRLKWKEYKELPESEKIRLKAEASRKPTPRPAPSKPAVAAKPPVTLGGSSSIAPATPPAATR